MQVEKRAQNWLISLSVLIGENGSAAPGGIQLLDALDRSGCKAVILTDKSQHTRVQESSLLNEIGYHTIHPEMIYTSAMAAIDAIVSKAPERRSAVYLGGRGLHQALIDGGFELRETKPDWLFLGLNRSAAYSDYCWALEQLENGAVLVSTDDAKTELYQGKKIIGNGAVVTMLEEASGHHALKAGMPSPLIMTQSLKYMNADASETLFIGADMKKEIRSADRAGISTVLITSDLSETENVFTADIHPTYFAQSLESLLR